MTGDERLEKLEKWLSELYGTAEKEMREKWDAYFKKQEEKAAKLLSDIREAKTPEAQKAAEARFQAHLRSMTSGNEYYRNMVDMLARQYHNANKEAAKAINSERADFFAEGYNLAAWKVNSVAVSQDIGIRFDMCSAEAVEWMADRQDDFLLPAPQVPKASDDIVWNVRKINSQVAQGIVQGESIPKIAARLQKVSDMNRNAAVRNARTMATACQNGGRVEAMKTAEKWGVKLRKRWICTLDHRTRDSHLELGGETIAEDAVFSNGCRFPGDPSGRPEEVYNCRCTLETVIDGFSSNLPKGKEDAVHVSIDGEELERGKSYLIKSRNDLDERAKQILEKRRETREARSRKRAENAAKRGESNPEEKPQEKKIPSIAGVERGAEMSHEEADSGRVNPNFSKGGGYRINCQSCVVAYEARRRGYDVEVVANDADHPICRKLSRDTLLAWKNKDGTPADYAIGNGKWKHSYFWNEEKPTPKRFEKMLTDNLEEGGRYTLEFSWKGLNAGGHIVMLEKSGGELKIYDPQPNRSYSGKEVSEYLKDLKYEKTFNGNKYYQYPGVTRIDDKEFDFEVASQIMEARKS